VPTLVLPVPPMRGASEPASSSIAGACLPWRVHGAGLTERPIRLGSRMARGVPPWPTSWPSTPASRPTSCSRQGDSTGSMSSLGVNVRTALCPTCGCRTRGSPPYNASAGADPLTTSRTLHEGHPRRPEEARRLIHALTSRRTTSSRIAGCHRVPSRHRQHRADRLQLERLPLGCQVRCGPAARLAPPRDGRQRQPAPRQPSWARLGVSP
jgi:hypothetical protein